MPAYTQAQAIKGEGGVYKVGNPYKVMGQSYTPEENYNYSEVGHASWYGSDFHAKKTANNENYDMNTLTAAHRTLPLPSIVKVTNLENGRSLVLRVNDRGPFVKNRIIDISKRGAQLLGFQTQGTAKVRVEVMEKESRELKAAMLGELMQLEATPVTPIKITESESFETETGIFVQAGSFSQKSSAEELQRVLSGVGTAQIANAEVDGANFYRVRFGPHASVADAENMLDKVINLGITNAAIVYN